MKRIRPPELDNDQVQPFIEALLADGKRSTLAKLNTAILHLLLDTGLRRRSYAAYG